MAAVMVANGGKPRRRKLSEDECALWGKVTRSVAPLKWRRGQVERLESDRPERASKQTPVKRAAPAALRQASLLTESAPRPVLLDRRLKQRLARGTAPIDARIDLHGRTQSEAHAALVRFLRNAQAAGAKVVLVITGKGARADGLSEGRGLMGERGVLKRQVPLWLGMPEVHSYVVGFEEAHIGHGGTGALYVRVRRRRVAE